MTQSLCVRRVVPATPQRVFDAWTDPDQLLRWWGPSQVTCTRAEVDARPGGAYRLDNQLPDGSVLVIRGEFLCCDPPRRLEYTWHVSPGAQERAERVTVEFNPHPAGTEVVVHHERIVDDHVARTHEQGWLGCFDGLVALLSRAAPSGVRR
jgi:uncharacterized protein YndB with AHSA1/START domain